MFSSKHYGWLPGIDVASILDATAYHTHQDNIDRIRPGTIQVSNRHLHSQHALSNPTEAVHVMESILTLLKASFGSDTIDSHIFVGRQRMVEAASDR